MNNNNEQLKMNDEQLKKEIKNYKTKLQKNIKFVIIHHISYIIHHCCYPQSGVNSTLKTFIKSLVVKYYLFTLPCPR